MAIRPPIKIIGLDVAIATINREILKVPAVTLAGLISGGFVIERAAKIQVPVDLGNLKASGTTIWREKASESPQGSLSQQVKLLV